MCEELRGKEISLQIKDNQVKTVLGFKKNGIFPCLCIVRDSQNPVIEKYVQLKKKYGEEIGVRVEDILVKTDELAETIEKLNQDEKVNGLILQFPILDKDKGDELSNLIAAHKDVDGLNEKKSNFNSATAEAILYLLEKNNIDLLNKKIALVGCGKLVGRPLIKIFTERNYNFEIFRSKDEAKLAKELPGFDIIITAVGKANLLTSAMIKDGAIVVDAGTACEDGKILGDVSDCVRERNNVKISAKIGGVGPLTITILFAHLIETCE